MNTGASFVQRQRSYVAARWPGVMVCVVIALAATFLSEHYGGPQLLYALLIGLSMNFLASHPQIDSGIGFCAKTVLRAGVALLGARITFEQVGSLGAGTGLVVILSMALTILCGLLLARVLGRPREEGLLSGGAVAICGASAALAVSSVLPQTRENERFTLLAVVGVTMLSTLAMVLYPFLLKSLDVNEVQAGVFLGATIHDVAQVVAAGLLVGQEAGEAATVVKLFRVMLLMPIVLLIAFSYRKHTRQVAAGSMPPLVPGFLLAFAALVGLASLGVFSAPVVAAAGEASRALLIVAIAAAGVKTSFADLTKLGWQPVLMMVAETALLAALMLAAILLMRLG